MFQDIFQLLTVFVSNLFAWTIGLRRTLSLRLPPRFNDGWRRRFELLRPPGELHEICPIKPNKERRYPDEDRQENKQQEPLKPTRLGPFLACHESYYNASRALQRFVIEIVGRIDYPHGFGLRSHDDRLRRRAAGEKMHTLQVVAIGHARGGKHHIAGC